MGEPRWSLHFAWGRAPYALDLPEVVIGSSDGCSLQISEPAAGAEHARFEVDDDERVWLEDLGTGHPTLHNGRAIRDRVQLTDGDFIQIGHSVLTLRGGARTAPKATAEARTVSAQDLPAEVTRALADRDASAAAKNFVVGSRTEAPASLQTMMMEAPVLKTEARETQRTIEANVDDLLAAVRQNTKDATNAKTLPPDQDTQQTEAFTALPSEPKGRALAQMPTLMGVGPSDLASQPTRIQPTPTKPLPTLPAPAPLPQRQSYRDLTGPTRELAAAPGADDDLSRRGRMPTAQDITPLPAPLPPHASIGDLGPLVNALTNTQDYLHDEVTDAQKALPSSAAFRTTEEPELASAATRQLAAVDVPKGSPLDTVKVDNASLPLHSQKTMLPTQAPVIVAQTAPHQPVTQPAPQKATVPSPKLGSSYEGEYVPPSEKGPFGSFGRAFDFFQQMFAMAKRQPIILRPMYMDLAIATPVMLVLSALLFVVPRLGYPIMLLGTAALYFIDYFCNALTASLIYDLTTTGRADMESARARVNKSLSGIATFAAISAILDVASTYARERNDLVAKIVLRIIYAIWTTATYIIMPAMVIESVPFKEAFSRSKKLMEHDPTGVGAGVVALSLCTYIGGAIIFTLGFFLMQLGAHVHPVLGIVLYFLCVNTYWAVSGWLKISYSTCFYLWASRCAVEKSTSPALAPLPLRHALDAA